MDDNKKQSDQQPDDKAGESTSPQFEYSKPETSTDNIDVPADEQSQQEVQTVQDTMNLDVSEQRMECREGFSSTTSAIDKVKEAEEKDLARVKSKENSTKTSEKLQDETTRSSFHDVSKVDKHSSFQNIGVDSVSELGGEYLAELPRDRLPDAATASANTSTSSSQSFSQQIAIPSTSRDSLGLGNERNPRKRPTNFGLHLKQSIHIFHPSNSSVLKKLPAPYGRGHNVYLRNSPESSDYGGSPDSLEDLLLMEALNLSDENLESTSRPQTPFPLYKEEMEKPSESSSIGESLDDFPPEPVGESINDRPTEPVGESLDDHPPEPVGENINDRPPEPVGESLDDHPPEPVGENLDEDPTEC